MTTQKQVVAGGGLAAIIIALIPAVNAVMGHIERDSGHAKRCEEILVEAVAAEREAWRQIVLGMIEAD